MKISERLQSVARLFLDTAPIVYYVEWSQHEDDWPEDDDEPFAEKMGQLVAQLRQQMEQGRTLDTAIEANLKELGYGG